MNQPVARASILALSLAAIAMLGGPSQTVAQEPLTLRLNDAVGRPGGLTALVFRTYASRPANQGQICGTQAFAPIGDGLTPFARLVTAEVLSQQDDARHKAALVEEGAGQSVVVKFRSPSGTINSNDGPLAVLFVRLDPSLTPGSVFEVMIDPSDTFLIDAEGQPVILEPVSGEVEILSLAAGYPVAVEGDKVLPGQVALVEFQTAEPRRLRGGQVAIEYDPTISDGPPVVKMNPGYGDATFTVDDLTPGLVVVNFSSPNSSLNRIPGALIAIELQTSAEVPLGTRSTLRLLPELTFLEDRAGDLVSLTFEGPGEIEFR